MIYLIIFFISITIDILYVKWFVNATTKKPIQSAIYSGILTLFSCLFTVFIIENIYNIIPMIFGHSLGSYLAVKYEKNNDIITTDSRI